MFDVRAHVQVLVSIEKTLRADFTKSLELLHEQVSFYMACCRTREACMP